LTFRKRIYRSISAEVIEEANIDKHSQYIFKIKKGQYSGGEQFDGILKIEANSSMKTPSENRFNSEINSDKNS